MGFPNDFLWESAMAAKSGGRCLECKAERDQVSLIICQGFKERMESGIFSYIGIVDR